MKALQQVLLKTAIFSCSLLLSLHVLADTPVGPMNYQGRLLDNNGIPVTGSYNFVVRVYDAASAGTLKYQEAHNAVTVNDGVYTFLIGTTTKTGGDSTWSVELWNCCTNLFMEIEVNGQILLPRPRLAAAPYAFQANLALTTNNALALGGKSASQYDNALATICVSSKGKWLELVGKCLGAGSSFTGTAVSWNTLTASSNFTGLDLTNADITGINFSGADFTGTTFKKTTYLVSGMSNANLTNTIWDGASANDPSAFSVAGTTNLTGATMKNMSMGKWNLSAITNEFVMHYFAAAYLSACPAGLFGVSYSAWQCKLMHANGSQYFLAGFYSNYSTTSPATMLANDEMVLDVDTNAFDNTNTSYSTFNGIVLTQTFLNGSFYQADLTNATFRNINFTNTNFNGTFVGSRWENVTIGSGISMNMADLTGAKLANVRFLNDITTPNFTKASLKQVDFDYIGGVGGPDFTDASLENVHFANLRLTQTKFDRTHISGDFHIEAIEASSAPTMTFNDIVFTGATVSGALTDLTFTGSFTIRYSVFKNLDLCSTSFPLTGSAPYTELATVKWEGAVECPDGTDVAGSATSYSGTCNYLTRMIQTAVANCTTGIPGTLQ